MKLPRFSNSQRIYLFCLILFLSSLAFMHYDKPFSDWFHVSLQPWDRYLEWITFGGDGFVLASFASLLTLGLWVSKKESWKTSALALTSLALCAIPTQILKLVFGRPRPYLEGDARLQNLDFSAFYWFAPNNDFRSLPSGHSAAAFTVAWIVAHQKHLSKGVKLLFIIGAFIVCLSRVALAKHFFTDTVAGAAVGIAVAQGLIDTLKFRARQAIKRKP